ncbi:MAG: hypothetical protein V3R68_05355, partial [Gammaproteobacteria bacterium]
TAYNSNAIAIRLFYYEMGRFVRFTEVLYRPYAWMIKLESGLIYTAITTIGYLQPFLFMLRTVVPSTEIDLGLEIGS